MYFKDLKYEISNRSYETFFTNIMVDLKYEETLRVHIITKNEDKCTNLMIANCHFIVHINNDIILNNCTNNE